MGLCEITRNAVAAMALAIGIDAHASADEVPRQPDMEKCAVTCEKEDAESIMLYIHKWTFVMHLGPLKISNSGCGVARVFKNKNNEFTGSWYIMIDKKCDGSVDGYAGTYKTNGLVVEEKFSGNEDKFKEYYKLFEETRNKVLEEKR